MWSSSFHRVSRCLHKEGLARLGVQSPKSSICKFHSLLAVCPIMLVAMWLVKGLKDRGLHGKEIGIIYLVLVMLIYDIVRWDDRGKTPSGKS